MDDFIIVFSLLHGDPVQGLGRKRYNFHNVPHDLCTHRHCKMKTHLDKHAPLATNVDGGIQDPRWISLEQEFWIY